MVIGAQKPQQYRQHATQQPSIGICDVVKGSMWDSHNDIRLSILLRHCLWSDTARRTDPSHEHTRVGNFIKKFRKLLCQIGALWVCCWALGRFPYTPQVPQSSPWLRQSCAELQAIGLVSPGRQEPLLQQTPAKPNTSSSRQCPSSPRRGLKGHQTHD